MFTEVLKIVPKIDSAGAATMERTLNARFGKIAKKFGGGVAKALAGGGIIGIATALIDKVLNPLQSVQEAIEKALSHGDDLATYAAQFNTTAGALARLQAFGRATGLEPEGVRLLLGKFQGAVAQAAGDPSKPSAVSNFVGRTDTAESFFEFVQGLQDLNKADPQAANRVQAEVFGERQILKASEFLNANFAELNSIIGGPTAQELTKAAERLAKLNDFKDIATASRELKDVKTKADRITDDNIASMINGEDRVLADDNRRILKYDSLKSMSESMDKILKVLEKGYLELSPYLSKGLGELIQGVTVGAKALEESRAIRGLIPGSGKDR